MLVHCKLIGQGTSQSPYDVPLPTKAMVSLDYVNLCAIVDVGLSDIPAPMQALAASYYTTYANGMTALSSCPSGILTAWYALLDARYPTQAGQFRPQVTT